MSNPYGVTLDPAAVRWAIAEGVSETVIAAVLLLHDQNVSDDDRSSFAGVGFNIVDERGAPIVTFGYLDQAKATNARALIERAIVDVEMIAPAGAYE
jgi:hypothetical protein